MCVMSGLLWKLNRLRAMGATEIAYRVRQAAQAQWERRGLGLARPEAPGGDYGRAWLAELPRDFDGAAYQAAADRVLSGRFDVFAMKDAALGFPPNWNRDPKTGTVAPLVFGKTLNYRDEHIVGDIKYLWEPNRHAELVTLAQAWHLTGEEKYAEGCRTLLESWFAQCPYPLGVNWTSSLEHGVRLVNWAVVWGMLGAAPSPQSSPRTRGEGVFSGEAGVAFRRRWLDAVYRHCHFIAGHLSRHSSANNHLLGELMGLLSASLTWPCWPESARWREQARAEFETEVLKQTALDGVNREQAIWYHHEVADMMLLVGLIGRANGVEFCPAYWERLERMLDFVAALMDVGGNVPMIGDADDAHMVRWVPEVAAPPPRPSPVEGEGEMHISRPSYLKGQGDMHVSRSSPVEREGELHVYRSLLATGAVLFERPDFGAKAGRFDDKSRWLLGDGAQARFEALVRQGGEARWARAFPEGGYYVLGADLGTPNEVRLVADVAPLGYLSIAAHGHADALAFTLSVAGREMLIDPGTYAYHTQKVWRDYFRGTSAHNTLRVDGVDQSVIGGNFLWTRHAAARCMEWVPGAETDSWVGEHDGYLRLPDPVTHRRQVVLDKLARHVQVDDRLDCISSHRIELFWHFSEDCDVAMEKGIIVARNNGVLLRMTVPDGLSVRLAIGDTDPPSGWVSRTFDRKVPCTTAVAAGVAQPGWRGSTTIEIYMLDSKGNS
jgi:hypothetical protein